MRVLDILPSSPRMLEDDLAREIIDVDDLFEAGRAAYCRTTYTVFLQGNQCTVTAEPLRMHTDVGGRVLGVVSQLKQTGHRGCLFLPLTMFWTATFCFSHLVAPFFSFRRWPRTSVLTQTKPSGHVGLIFHHYQAGVKQVKLEDSHQQSQDGVLSTEVI